MMKAELPPIALSKFLSLVGVSFLDHLNASTRRRTIPHRAGGDGSTATYRSADLVKAMAVSVPEFHSYREACRLLKQSIDASRAFADEQEKKVSKKNPEYFREFRESSTDTKDFMKDRFKMIKVHSKLETNAAFSIWKTDVLKAQQETQEQHLVELGKDISNLATLRSSLERERTKVLPRRDELKLQVVKATDRQRSYELCDKEQLASLAEAAEEQGAQIEHYESVKAKKAKELAELRARVEKLKLTEQYETSRIAVAEKKIQDNQYVRMEDLGRAKDMLSIIEATHHWEPLRPSLSTSSSSSMAAAAILQPGPGRPLEFVYDRTLKVSIEFEKIGEDPNAVQVAEFESEEMVDRQRISAITALAPKKRKDIKEYVSLLRDYTTMIASKYKAGTTISKILSDISQFWNKICMIRRDVELVRAHHVVDLVAGSAENLKELESDNNNSNGTASQRQVAGTTPTVVLDIRVRFTGPIKGVRKSTQNRGGGGGADTDMDGVKNGGHHRSNTKNEREVPSTEPVKFYLWFTFTLTDLLSFPGPNSFTWRLEVVYGNISNEHVSQAVGPVAKKGGYEVLREICIAVNQLLKI
ncbi:Spc7 kinetochore protein-domain-containing protein [Dissophora ornata]|nr:Spc7 kinetochore protein-domain-containing protein [Dissophora ornata]